jgi:subtilisin family serine protease
MMEMKFLRCLAYASLIILAGCGIAPTPAPYVYPTPVAPTFAPLLPYPTPNIDGQPAASGYGRGKLEEIGKFDPQSGNPFEIDLRSYDLTGLDLSGAQQELQYASFDNRTTWPAPDKLPAGYDWQQVMDTGKNPGLGVRGLHEQGITGSGVGIAILDQPLQIDHPEYRDQLRLYEEINIVGLEAQMHGPAVASLAVGKTVGVAPGADLYFIADWFSDPDREANFAYLAIGIRRVLEINRSLPQEHRIRVISISRGSTGRERGYGELVSALKEAEAQGVAVISVGMYGSKRAEIQGLGRDPLADPDAAASYRPAAFLMKDLNKLAGRPGQLWVLIDARTTASPTGTEDYAFYGVGGMSWAEPYLAGVYALACQVDPSITPERFWTLATQTGQYVEIPSGGKTVKIGPIVNPPGLIQTLKAN